MANKYFAELDGSNVVIDVAVVSEEDAPNEAAGIAICKLRYGSSNTWVETSKTGSFRNKYAGLGNIYDPTNDVFYAAQPYPSWIISAETNWIWECPVAVPSDWGNEDADPPTYYITYTWDEDTISWGNRTKNLYPPLDITH